MALILYEGFDTKATADLGTVFDTVGPATTITQNGRDGGRALTSNYQTGDLSTKNLPAPVDTLVFGFALRIPTGYANNAPAFPFVALSEGTTRHVGLLINSAGQIGVYRDTTYLGAQTPRIEPATWYYVEGKIKVASTGGFVVLRVNGSIVANVTGLNTRNGGVTGLVNRFQVWPGAGASNTANYIDDLYVLDTTGTQYTDFLGDQRIINGATAPAAGDAARRVVFVAT